MPTPQFNLDRWWWVPRRSGERGEHVLPDSLFDKLPEWPLDSNRPAAAETGDHIGMKDACYMTKDEAFEALHVAQWERSP